MNNKKTIKNNNHEFIEEIKYKYIERNINDIIKLLEKTNKKVFSVNDLGKILNKYDENTNNDASLVFHITRKTFINALLHLNIIYKIPVKCSVKNINRYILKNSNVNIYEKALSFNSESYLSHYTAVFLHGLTLNVPKVIYTNKEQYENKNKTKQSELRQINIDKAFSRELRKTQNIAYLKKQPNDIKVVMLNSKYINNSNDNFELLVVDDSLLPVTSVERTLIDIVIRPEYSGGILEVINIFKNAVFSIDKLISLLNISDYIYPYHQALGFYLELAGYSENILERFNHYNFNYNFYLTHKMIDPLFSKRWKIYYPNYIDY